MNLTVDANVLFAALIRDGTTRRLLFHSALELNAPYFLLNELNKYRATLFSKSRLSEKEFQSIVEKNVALLKIIPLTSLSPYLEPASLLIEDEKDLTYIAAALCTNSAIISNDKGMKKQSRVMVYTVDELAGELGIN